MHLSWPASLLIGLTGAEPAQAAPDVKNEIYPNRPVRFVIPFAAAAIDRLSGHRYSRGQSNEAFKLPIRSSP